MAETSAGERPASRQARAEQTRQRLIDAAVRHFSERHYDEVAVSDIAESAGVAHGVLFHHFQNKRGLYLEAMRQAARELDMVAKVAPGLSSDQQLRRLLALHLEYLAENRGLALRLILGGRGTDPDAWELFEDGRWRIIEWFCVQLGLDPEADALRMMLRSAVGAIDEAIVYWLTHGQPYDIETMTGTLAELAVGGLHAAGRLDPSLDVDGALVRAIQQAPLRSAGGENASTASSGPPSQDREIPVLGRDRQVGTVLAHDGPAAATA